MENVIKIFEQIKNESSKNGKINIIKQNSDNELFKKCLVFLLDSNVVTGISKKKIDKELNIINILCDFEAIIEFLTINNTGKDSDVALIQGFIYNQPQQYQQWYKDIVTKNYKLGADAKLVNSAIPNLIPAHDVMLGTSIEHCNIKPNTWFSLSHKLNGTRTSYSEADKLFSRQGKEFKGVQHIIDDINILFPNKDMFVDGEMLAKNDGTRTDSENFQYGTGLANSKDTDKSILQLVIFDIFPLSEYQFNGCSKDTYKVRRKNLLELNKRINDLGLQNVKVVDMFYEGTDQEEIWKWLKYAEENDLEGCMINLDTSYESKRTKNLIKVKQFYTFDLPIIDVIEGDNRLKGTLGALVVDFKGNKVNVGSGYSDSLRNELWSIKDELIGRVIEVKYKEISKDKKTGLESLQFPIFQSLREVGKQVSYE